MLQLRDLSSQAHVIEMGVSRFLAGAAAALSESCTPTLRCAGLSALGVLYPAPDVPAMAEKQAAHTTSTEQQFREQSAS